MPVRSAQTNMGQPVARTLTFRCCKEGCGREYSSTATEPKCPHCRSTRRQWIPVRIAVSKVAAQVDRDVRLAASQYGFSNFRKTYEGEKTAPARATSNGQAYRNVNLPGFDHAVPMPTDAAGNLAMQSVCVPNGVGMPVKSQWGTRRPSGRVPGTTIAAATLQRTLPKDDNP